MDQILSKIKIVIWDLDDTYWKGTLSEGDIEPGSERNELVVELSRHGIINSIASNNDAQIVEARLTTSDMWKWFVFPELSWEDKTAMVKRILENSALRAENALFIDDKARLRQAVKEQVPGITCLTVEEFEALFREWRIGRTHKDPTANRLAHYRLLERKHSSKQLFLETASLSNDDFLRRSNIQCTIIPLGEDNLERVCELLQRANQLNFTGQRSGIDRLKEIMDDREATCGAISVADVFGDYGICGFFALESTRAPALTHFVFSCRVLNMGVEEAIYRHLNQPEILCSPHQRSAVDRMKERANSVDWVKITDLERSAAVSHRLVDPTKNTVHFIGPCDLQVLEAVIKEQSQQMFSVNTQMMSFNDRGRLITHFGHRCFLDLMTTPQIVARHAETLSQLPWFDPQLVARDIFDDQKTKVVVLSVARNAQCAEYLHISGDFSVPLDFYRLGGRDWTITTSHQSLERFLQNYHHGCPADFAKYFAKNFKFQGPTSHYAFSQTLNKFVNSLPENTYLAIINLADVQRFMAPELVGSEGSLINRWKRQHSEINRAVEACAIEHPAKVVVLDINDHLRTPADFVEDNDGIGFHTYYHYQRHIFVKMANDLLNAISRWGLL